MLFSSSLFVFLFLPLVLALYFSLRVGLRNALLLVASLFFYAWGEKALVALLLLSIVSNWAFGVWVEKARARGRGRGALAVAIVFNVAILVVFKYADWIWGILSSALVAAGVRAEPLPPPVELLPATSILRTILFDPGGHVHLPLGVSFFTFQATSYVIDVWRRDVGAEKSLVDFGMYKAFFPQLIAGPIVRYRDIHAQIRNRLVDTHGFAYGIRRFVIGLGKKMLIANVAARGADVVFGNPGVNPAIPQIPAEQLTLLVSWFGIACYSLQIYFDFSGYSDMAIGLGHMFGFRFLENFNYPYISRSITEFWRRWHISLSSWFRDYLYIPLGGNRGSPGRTYFNLLLVFFLCGLWHGAAFNFVVWGLFHGTFLVIERVGFGAWLDRRTAALRHVYVLLVVMVGWVFFRAPDLTYALGYLEAMTGLQAGRPDVHHVSLWLDSVMITAILCGFLGSTPWLPRVAAWQAALEEKGRRALGLGLEIAGLVGLACVFFGSALELSAGTYNPFIYFRF